MAKLVTKFKFLKPGARQGRGGYAKYIATRDGVEKIDDTKKFAPATWNQKQLIKKILRDFPDSREMLEYEDYQQKQTVESASEFISRAIEDNAAVALNAKTYADYIATRPRAERFGSHGLFTDDGVQVNLSEVSRELNEYGGNVWTASVMGTALSRLNSFLDSELEQILCFDTEIDAERFCNEKCAVFVILPEENPNSFFMISLIIQQLYREILSVADENGGKLKNRCVFFADEFGTSATRF